MTADPVAVETLLEWAQEHVRSCLHGTLKYQRVAYLYIARFQDRHHQSHPGRCFLESLDRTDFLRQWLQQVTAQAYSRHTVRIWLFTVQRFTAWLLHLGRIQHDVLAYVTVSEVLDGRIPELWLRHNLQPDIARFKVGGKKDRREIEHDTAVWAAHSWNLHLNQRRAHLDSFPDFDEALLLEWMAMLARQAPSVRRAVDCTTGLERFLDYLAEGRRLSVHPVRQLRQRYDSRPAVFRVLRESDATSLPDIQRILEPLRKTAFFKSGLGGWMQAYLQHRLGRGKKIAGPRSRLHILDGVLRRHGIEQADHITAGALEDFLGENAASTSTRNNRLATYRGFVRFLQIRGQPTSCTGHEWELLPEPRDFRPHIFSLQELGRLLQWIQARSEVSPHPLHWRTAETVIYLLYACGMRLREPLMLRLRDVDLEARTFFIACTKFYKQRWVPFGLGAARRLAAYLDLRGQMWPNRNAADEPLFLNGHGRAFSDYGVWRVFRDAVAALEIQSRGTRPPRLHDLRHSCAVHRLYKWYADGADVQNKLPLLSTYLGHAKICSTQNYLHLTEDLLRQAGRGFQATLDQVLGGWGDHHDPAP